MLHLAHLESEGEAEYFPNTHLSATGSLHQYEKLHCLSESTLFTSTAQDQETGARSQEPDATQ